MKAFFSLLMMLACLTIAGQSNQINVSGTVTDNRGIAMRGVTVTVKATARTTTTDANGRYAFALLSPNHVLVFSMAGYQTREERIGGRTVVNISLNPMPVELEEVVTSAPTMQRDKKMACSAKMEVAAGCVMPSAYCPPSEFNTESYARISENGFRETTREPLSTFSVDVDRASYANVRRYLNQGQLPPVDAVRIEEMVNYFDYAYPQPKNGEPFSVNTELAVCPWNASHFVMKVGLKGREMDKSQLPPSNLVFLIDVSGSMNMPNKLPLLKSAFALLVNQLRPADRVAMVVYAGAAGVVLPSTAGNNKQAILDALERLQAGGSTAGGEGLKLAYAVAHSNFIKGGNNRIVLATDGDFNVGVSSTAEMERLVETERERGVCMTVLGFGMGNYKDDKVETIADKGNGNYSYIDNMQEAHKTLVREFGGTLFTIAKDVKLQLEFNPSKIAAYRLIGYENRVLANEDFNNDKKDAGDIGAGHTVTALYELVPVGAPDAAQYQGKVDALKYQPNPVEMATGYAAEWLTLKLRYKAPDGDKSLLITTEVKGPIGAFAKATTDMRFATGVAAFGMMLRNSEHKGAMSYPQAINIMANAKGTDAEGYRGEAVRLAKLAESFSPSTQTGIE